MSRMTGENPPTHLPTMSLQRRTRCGETYASRTGRRETAHVVIWMIFKRTIIVVDMNATKKLPSIRSHTCCMHSVVLRSHSCCTVAAHRSVIPNAHVLLRVQWPDGAVAAKHPLVSNHRYVQCLHFPMLPEHMAVWGLRTTEDSLVCIWKLLLTFVRRA